MPPQLQRVSEGLQMDEQTQLYGHLLAQQPQGTGVAVGAGGYGSDAGCTQTVVAVSDAEGTVVAVTQLFSSCSERTAG